MYYKGKLNYRHKKLALSISILLSLAIIIVAEIMTAMSLSIWIPAILILICFICTAELYYSEKHGSAIIPDGATELMIEQVFLFGLMKVRKHYETTDEFREFLKEMMAQNIETFNIPHFNKTLSFDITFLKVRQPLN